MFNLKSHFNYNKSERIGILFLVVLIVVLQLIYFFIDFSSPQKQVISNNKNLDLFYKEIDSLNNLSKNDGIKPFNPNYISDFRGYQLGLSTEEIDKLHEFRKTGQFINSAKQFQEVTGVNDSLLNSIKVYFSFPDWKNTNNSTANNQAKKELLIEGKKDINLVTSADLKIVNGVGDVLSERIIKYRDKLQGFSYNHQLYEVWNLDKDVAHKVLSYFEVKSKPTIKKLNVNTASFKELLSIVYIDYELTKKIVAFRIEKAEIQSIEELKKIEGFPLDKFDRITLYLDAY